MKTGTRKCGCCWRYVPQPCSAMDGVVPTRSPDMLTVFRNLDEARHALRTVARLHPEPNAWTTPGQAPCENPTNVIAFWLVCDYLHLNNRKKQGESRQSICTLSRNLGEYFRFDIPNGATIAALIHSGFKVKDYMVRNFRYICFPAAWGNRPQAQGFWCWPDEAVKAWKEITKSLPAFVPQAGA